MRTAMIADDDEQIRHMLSELLSVNGISVIAQAKNGKEATDLFEKLRPEIVLLDVSMPVYDGIYALERINKYDSVKVIMVTGNKDTDNVTRLQDLRPTTILFKPASIDDILDAIKR